MGYRSSRPGVPSCYNGGKRFTPTEKGSAGQGGPSGRWGSEWICGITRGHGETISSLVTGMPTHLAPSCSLPREWNWVIKVDMSGGILKRERGSYVRWTVESDQWSAVSYGHSKKHSCGNWNTKPVQCPTEYHHKVVLPLWNPSVLCPTLSNQNVFSPPTLLSGDQIGRLDGYSRSLNTTDSWRMKILFTQGCYVSDNVMPAHN